MYQLSQSEKKDRANLLRKLHKNNYTVEDIANESGLSKANVYKWLRILNLKPNDGSRNSKLKIGEKHGKWTILSIAERKSSRNRLRCRCDCGTIKDVTANDLLILKNGKRKSNSCGCWKTKNYKEISGLYFNTIRNNAIKRKLDFEITIEYMWDLFLKQNRKCAFTGEELFFITIGNSSKRSEQTASLDRIDSKKGYINGNVQWVHKDINSIKQDFHDSEFLKYVEKIYNYRIKNENSKYIPNV